jgi:hypothetical protein
MYVYTYVYTYVCMYACMHACIEVLVQCNLEVKEAQLPEAFQKLQEALDF